MVRTKFAQAREQWAEQNRIPLFDPADRVAWYIFQARAYAEERQDWFEPEAYRIAPVFRRLGQDLALLRQTGGIEDRVNRLMTSGRRQPDDGLYELLVAAAYQRRGWAVQFVPERPGIARTPDLSVQKGRRRWAAECKRVGQTGYAAQERAIGEQLSRQLHERCRRDGLSVIAVVRFVDELQNAPDNYLAEKLDGLVPTGFHWSDPISEGAVIPATLEPLQAILEHDDIFFGSSRMIELLLGQYSYLADYSMEGTWEPAVGRPFHATAVSQVSLVGWLSQSRAAARRKARHFRSVIGQAASQLPSDCPGVVHVGYEAIGGNSVDSLRHYLNFLEMRSFEPGESRLRWVYGNYIVPEHTTARYESAAVTETTAAYRVGRHTTVEPLPGHMLFSDDEGSAGAHW